MEVSDDLYDEEEEGLDPETIQKILDEQDSDDPDSGRKVNIFAAWVGKHMTLILVDFARLVRMHCMVLDRDFVEADLEPESEVSSGCHLLHCSDQVDLQFWPFYWGPGAPKLHPTSDTKRKPHSPT